MFAIAEIASGLQQKLHGLSVLGHRVAACCALAPSVPAQVQQLDMCFWHSMFQHLRSLEGETARTAALQIQPPTGYHLYDTASMPWSE